MGPQTRQTQERRLLNLAWVRESEKVGLKLNIQKTKIMASGPITSWQTDEETVAIFLGSKITADGDCSHEIKRCFGRKVMPNLDSIFKSRDITLPTKVHLVKRVGLWRKLSTEELMLLNCGVGEDYWVPWIARKSNQSTLKEISTGCSLEGMMLKLKLQYFSHLMWKLTHWKRPWCWERLKAGGEGDNRGPDSWMASPAQWTWVWASSRSWWWTGRPGMLQSTVSQRVGLHWTTEVNWERQKSACMCAEVLSDSALVWLCASLWTAACQALLSSGISRQEYWSGVPLPSHLVLIAAHVFVSKLISILTPIAIDKSSIQLISHVRLFVTPWTTAHLASLSITNSWSLLELLSIKSVMPSIHLILCHLRLRLTSLLIVASDQGMIKKIVL